MPSDWCGVESIKPPGGNSGWRENDRGYRHFGGVLHAPSILVDFPVFGLGITCTLSFVGCYFVTCDCDFHKTKITLMLEGDHLLFVVELVVYSQLDLP